MVRALVGSLEERRGNEHGQRQEGGDSSELGSPEGGLRGAGSGEAL